jgi:hypothetical protein
MPDTSVFMILGGLALAGVLILLGLLSKRLGAVTRAPRYYVGFFVAAGLMVISEGARLVNVFLPVDPVTLHTDPIWVLFYNGLPAIALTISVVIAWRYWSWLLAERG